MHCCLSGTQPRCHQLRTLFSETKHQENSTMYTEYSFCTLAQNELENILPKGEKLGLKLCITCHSPF